jgi:hypothetical protein
MYSTEIFKYHLGIHTDPSGASAKRYIKLFPLEKIREAILAPKNVAYDTGSKQDFDS